MTPAEAVQGDDDDQADPQIEGDIIGGENNQ